MATVMAAKPSAPHQQGKMKRPPPPAVQTNGIQPSQTSPSPSTASKRLPSASFKTPPTPTVNGVNGVNGSVNGVQPRLSNRRRDGQRPGETQGRTRNGRDGHLRQPKNRSEPYVKDQAYILKKYKGVPPSLIIHLHPTLFRFDQQDGSFSYNSPMRFVLEHLRNQTVPHDMIEELNQSGVKFYEGCLIVQVKDHRNAKGEGSSSSSDVEAKDTNKPFSIHNYSNFVTPSPYVPYPEKNASPATTPDKSQRKEGQTEAPKNGKQKATEPEPKTYTVVLFPTPLSMQEEVIIQSMTPDVRPGNRKQGGTVSRTPASATVPATPTGLIPPTPGLGGPQAKRQKMSITGLEVLDFESKVITANAAPLFLEPAKDLEESQHILEKLTDPLHKEDYPAPKSRKRTIAELAADEAQAASEQAFMLIMDERIGPAMSANGAKAGSSDEAGTAPFQPSFERFNLVQQLKKDQEQRAREKQIHDADIKRQKDKLEAERAKHQQEQQALRAQQVHHEQQMRIRQQARNAEIQKNAQQNQLAQEAAARQMAQATAMNNMHHGHPNGLMANGMPHGVSQAQHSSPVVRTATPHSNPSPTVGNHQQGGIPMGMTSSGQGGNASSPQRPPSALQHPNAAAQSMARNQNRNAMNQPSRTGTPLVNGTPNMAHVTPQMGHVQPTARMQQGSPPNTGMMPVMPNQTMVGNPQINGMPNGMPPQMNHMNQQQQAQYMEMRRRQQAQMIAMHQQQQGHPPQTPGGGQMSPEQQKAAMQMLNQRQAYQQQLAQHHAQLGSANGAHGHPGQLPNGVSSHPPQNPQAGGHPGQQHPGHQQQLQQRPNLTPAQQKQAEWTRQHIQRQLNALAQTKYNGQVQMVTNEEKMAAQQHANTALMQLMQREKMRAQHTMQQQRQNAAMMQNMQHLQAMQQQQQQGGGQMAAMARGGGGGQGLSQQQMMQQMAQMPQMGGNGMGNMNMNGMHMGMGNGMNGGGMNMNGMNGGMGGGMGNMQ